MNNNLTFLLVAALFWGLSGTLSAQTLVTHDFNDGELEPYEIRKSEIQLIVEENGLVADIEVNSDVVENIIELEGILNKPKTMTFEKTPKRNDPCSCGSGKKYKKCCG